MANPVANLQRTAAEYQQMSKKDQKRFVTDLILNNALYILMAIFVIYTAIMQPNFIRGWAVLFIFGELINFFYL